MGNMRIDMAGCGEALPGALIGKYLVYSRKHFRRGAEGACERHIVPCEFCLFRALLEIALHCVEACGVCALKREDRLLFIAHGEDGAAKIARASARQKLICNACHDIPLLGACILCFIDQNMVYATIELEEHPR